MTYRKIARQFAVAAILLAAMLALSVLQAAPHAPSASSPHAGHEGMDMSAPMDGQMQSTMHQAILAQNKKESEFNHHLAGFLVILASLFLLGGDKPRPPRPPSPSPCPASPFVC